MTKPYEYMRTIYNSQTCVSMLELVRSLKAHVQRHLQSRISVCRAVLETSTQKWKILLWSGNFYPRVEVPLWNGSSILEWNGNDPSRPPYARPASELSRTPALLRILHRLH